MYIVTQDTQEKINLSDQIFGCNFNMPLVHQIVTLYQNNNRKNISAQKTRSLVKGSKCKPWKQKGTGRARAGTKKSIIWRKGGVAFTNANTNYYSKINKKMYRNALKSIFSQLIRTSRLHVFQQWNIVLPKTKLLVEKIKFYQWDSVLFILLQIKKYFLLASRNLYYVCLCTINHINILNLFRYSHIILTIDSIKILERLLS